MAKKKRKDKKPETQKTRKQIKHELRNAYRASIRKKSRNNHTPGRSKQENCKASVDDKYYAKAARAYKDLGYAEWCKRTRQLNRQ